MGSCKPSYVDDTDMLEFQRSSSKRKHSSNEGSDSGRSMTTDRPMKKLKRVEDPDGQEASSVVVGAGYPGPTHPPGFYEYRRPSAHATVADQELGLTAGSVDPEDEGIARLLREENWRLIANRWKDFKGKVLMMKCRERSRADFLLQKMRISGTKGVSTDCEEDSSEIESRRIGSLLLDAMAL